ncbi:MAG TPA: site-2 protease family protein [Vicinamibacteria bacterium]|nr:site-2 protease family protein [Vicinamibacteria bacterium]
MEPGRPVFYRIDSTRVSFREYAWGGGLPSVLLAMVLKSFRVRIPSATDDPNVEALAPFEVPADAMPEDVRLRFEPLTRGLLELGFEPALHHRIEDDLHSATTWLVTCTRPDGRAWARLHEREWRIKTPPKRNLFTEIVTPFTGGAFVWSLSSKPDLLAPPSCTLVRRVGAAPAELWRAHVEAVEPRAATAVPVTTPDALRASVRQHHSAVRSFHLRRGVFAAMTEEDRTAAVATAAHRRAAESGGSSYPQVMAEVRNLEQQKSSWTTAVIVLVASFALFLGAAGTSEAGRFGFSWRWLGILVPILLFHEAGHWVAMRVFGYRNLRMFFIPFLGAAVSGRHYNVPGWKKAIVSLAGPLPGIVVGTLLGALGLLLRQPLTVEIAVTALVVNAINLLPVLPLDGGWVVQAIAASRSVLWETAFRVFAVAGLLGLGLLSRDRVLLVMGALMLVSLPASYKLARIVRDLRRSDVDPASADDQTIPLPTAEAIIGKVAEAFPSAANKVAAQHTLSVFEALNARPPGGLASVALAVVQGGALVSAGLFAVLLVVGQSRLPGGLNLGMRQPMPLPEHRLDAAQVSAEHVAGTSRASEAPHNTVVATFGDPGRASSASAGVRTKLPAGAGIGRFGETLLVALPAADDAARKDVLAAMQSQGADVFVATPDMAATLSLSCEAETIEAATAIEQEASAYFLASPLKVVPPWAEGDTRTPSERASHDQARRTYARVVRASGDASTGPAAVEHLRKVMAARRAGDAAEAERLLREHKELLARQRTDQMEKLRSEPGVDVALIDRYRSIVGRPGEAEELAAALGPYLGQLRQDGPDPRGNSSAMGFLTRENRRIALPYVRFASAFHGPPAMTRWLLAQGCGDFRYRFQPGVPVSDLGEEED